MRTALCIAIIALAACSKEKPPERVIANELINQSQRMMKPVNDEIQESLAKFGEDMQKRQANIKKRLRQGKTDEPVRSCIIDGVRTFDNRGNLCPDKNALTAN